MRLAVVPVILLLGSLASPQSPAAQEKSEQPKPIRGGVAQNPSGKPKRIRIGGNVEGPRLAHHVQPVYPPLAKAAQLQGTVRLEVLIAKDGSVREIKVLSGHPLFIQAVMDAVHQWRYEPTLLNQEPVEVVTTVDVIFSLPGSEQAAEAKPPVIDPVREAEIRRLLDLSGGRKHAAESGRQMGELLRPVLLRTLPPSERNPQIVDRILQKFVQRLDSAEILDYLVPVYAKHFAHEEIRQLIQFYDSPIGRRLLEVTPSLMQDASAASQKWMQKVMPGIVQELREEFPELKQNKKE